LSRVIVLKVYLHALNKKKTPREKFLQEEVKRLDLLASQGPTDSIFKELLRAKEELNKILNQKTEQILLKLRQQQFKFEEKTSTFWANQLKQQTEKSIIASTV